MRFPPSPGHCLRCAPGQGDPLAYVLHQIGCRGVPVAPPSGVVSRSSTKASALDARQMGGWIVMFVDLAMVLRSHSNATLAVCYK
jgi:hypothetical protein